MLRKTDHNALRVALKKVEAFLAASREEPSSCATFKDYPGSGHEPFSDEQKRAVRIYVESWIHEPLAAVLAALDGERTFSNDQIIQSHARDLHRPPATESRREA